VEAPSALTSLVVIIVWLAFLIGVSTWYFRRQDIMN